MITSLEPLLLNVLFIILFLLFVPLLLEWSRHHFFIHNKRRIVNMSALLAIISCISFPITIMEGYIFDLRLVVLIVAGLYGGIASSIFLACATIIYRFLIGGPGALATVMIVTIVLVFLLLLCKHFQASSPKKKIIIGCSLSLLATILAILNSTFIFEASFHLEFLLTYVSLSIGSTLLLIFFYEIFQENILINKRIIKADKMEIVSHLASSVSHEVRNPLTVVRGFLQLMDQQEMTEEQRRAYVKIAIDEIDRANEIIRNYLTFAKPSPENITTLNIREEIERTLQIIMPLANMNGVKIEKKIEAYYIKGEKQFFLQSLLNITKNCIEAMPESGSLRIETITAETKLTLLISDNGNGMTKEQLSHLGEPYFTTKGREGTGLGMMAAIKIIESMGGSLKVTSKLNEGTKFYITLPLVKSIETN